MRIPLSGEVAVTSTQPCYVGFHERVGEGIEMARHDPVQTNLDTLTLLEMYATQCRITAHHAPKDLLLQHSDPCTTYL